jgi:hypothetical protein
MTSADEASVIDPLVASLLALRKALTTDEHSLGAIAIPGRTESEYTREDWDHVKLVSGIMQQRQRLNTIVFSFCSSVGDFMTNLFSGILKHKALNDMSKSSSVLVRRYSFSTAQFEVLVCSGRAPPPLSAAERGSALQQKNQMLGAQRSFQAAVMTFLPVLELTLGLGPSLLFRVTKAYTEAAQQYLYGPLLRQLFKEVLPLTSSQSAISFASLPRSKPTRAGAGAGAGAGPGAGGTLTKFHELGVLAGSASLVGQASRQASAAAGITALHIWDSVLIMIMITAPVVAREEAFFQVS